MLQVESSYIEQGTWKQLGQQTVQGAREQMDIARACGSKVALVHAGAGDQLLQRSCIKQLEEKHQAGITFREIY